MSRRYATKDNFERETEETERLVRPAPKVKPPRRDRRRETVEPDKDPDLSTHDPDLSKNYKDIGGSIGARVFKRWADGGDGLFKPKKDTAGPSKTKTLPPPPPPAGPKSKPPAGPEPKIPVRRKVDKEIVYVTDSALKESPEKYEKADPSEAKSEGPKSQPDKSSPEEDKAKPLTEALKGKDKLKDPWADAQEGKLLDSVRKFPRKEPAQGEAVPEAPPPSANSTKPDPEAAKPKPVPKPKETKTLGLREDPAPAPTAEQVEADYVVRGVLDQMSAEDPALKSNLKGFVTPGSDIYGLAENNPKLPVSVVLRQFQLPPEIKTIGDVQRVLKLPARKAPPKGKGKGKKTKSEAPAEAPVTTPAAPPSAPPAAAAPAAAPPATAPPVVPEDKPGPSKSEQEPSAPASPAPASPSAAPSGPDQSAPAVPPASPAAAPAKAPPAKTKAPKLSDKDRDKSINLIVDSFPSSMAADLLAMQPPMHPDEVNDLIKDYKVGQSIPVKDIGSFIDTASKFFTTDPSKVKPPKVFKLNGQDTPWDQVPEEQKAAALRKHQVKTLAFSMAAASAVSKELQRKSGAPESLANGMAKVMLTSSTNPVEKAAQSKQLAEDTFYQQLESGDGEKLSSSKLSKILKSNPDPNVQRVAVAYSQGQDYQEARKHFLKGGEAIDERQSPEEILRGLSKATKFLRDKSDQYPQPFRQDTASIFRQRILKQLESLVPEKAKALQPALDKQDNVLYEGDLRKFRKDYEKFSKSYTEAQKKLNSSDPDAVTSWLAERGIYEPQEPQEPAKYKDRNRPQADKEQEASDAWDDYQTRMAASRVRARYQSAFSSYSNTFAMDRKAVYWGVDPYSEEPDSYPGWHIPRASALGDQDFSRILKSAKSWLDAPVLSSNIDGIDRDVQLRAALDLAIRSEGYSSAIHPTIYENLLARLAGAPEKNLTATARNDTMTKKVSLEVAQADRVLSRLDRVASVVQERHQEWGLSFKAAKQLVNEIDKIADELEKATFGEQSVIARQASVLGLEKTAEVIQRDSDEPYMDTFDSPMMPIQREADEPYMQQYSDDQSRAVAKGKSLNNRPLTPNHKGD